MHDYYFRLDNIAGIICARNVFEAILCLATWYPNNELDYIKIATKNEIKQIMGAAALRW